MQRRLYRRGVVDVGYVGSAGDHLIQPVNINQPQPQDVVALDGAVNRARPYRGLREHHHPPDHRHSPYHGLLVGFRHEGGRRGHVRPRLHPEPDEDGRHQRPRRRRPAPEPAGPRGGVRDRAHGPHPRVHRELRLRAAVLPERARASSRQLLGGWQVSGITQFWSGPPISRVVNGTTNGSRRGIRVNQMGDPSANLPADVPGGVYWFNPAAFASPADGTYGNTGRAIFRLPGVNQWDITLSKNWYPTRDAPAVPGRLHQRLQPHAARTRTGSRTPAARRTNPTCAVGRQRLRPDHRHARPAGDPARLRLTWN